MALLVFFPACFLDSFLSFSSSRWQQFSFTNPLGGDSSDEGEEGSGSDDDEESDVEEEEIDGVGMSASEERLVASFMNAGKF